MLALKLMMILSLVCLQVLDCSKVLLDLLLDGENVADMLPNKFVSDLLRRRDDVSSLINVPCAIFADLMKFKEEIMSELIPTKTALPDATCSTMSHESNDGKMVGSDKKTHDDDDLQVKVVITK
ncbi:hypothetical protein Tco_0055190, partial [Tanacetum coccineum]